MKVLLTAVNTKYIHSNPAVYGLKAYFDRYGKTAPESGQTLEVQIAEYTINQQLDDILSGIYVQHPDVIAFSCYLWNIDYIEKLQIECRKVLPHVRIWVGGPEVTYDAVSVLSRCPATDLVIVGEGEKSFTRLCEALVQTQRMDDPEQAFLTACAQIGGICYRQEGTTICNRPMELCDMDELPFFYEDLSQFANKILYYESSRGCPYGCSYCLSSVSRQVRFRSLPLVYKELGFFIRNRVKQVKFVDRTFNCSHERTTAIFRFLMEHDNGVTNFHFEIAGDLINQEEIALLQQMRPGLVQLEIGVQTVNPKTLQAIHRTAKLETLQNNVAAIHAGRNVHQHLDLIAGLPFENMESFRNSFNQVYRMQPDQLQLGFLKVLKGSDLYTNAERYGIVYQSRPPYEVLYTKWITYDEILYLKKIAQMVELYDNSRLYVHTMQYWGSFFAEPFSMFAELVDYYERRDLFSCSHNRISRYMALRDCMLSWAEKSNHAEDTEQTDRIKNEKKLNPCQDTEDFAGTVSQILTYDLYLRENLKTRPSFALEQPRNKDMKRLLCQTLQLPKTVHVEQFTVELARYLPDWKCAESQLQLQEEDQKKYLASSRKDARTTVIFNYEQMDPLDHAAAVTEVISIK